MSTRARLIGWVFGGMGLIIVALYLPTIKYTWRAVLVFAGGWLLALGMRYQVKLFADQKDGRYYILVVFAVLFYLLMAALTLFWLVTWFQ